MTETKLVTNQSNLQLFSNPEFGEIRTVTINEEPWFVGKDVAIALGYTDADQALRKHVDADDKLTRQIDGTGQKRSMTVINESGLYSLILSSKLESAKRFKHWVTGEVLPTIRKTGGYVNNDEQFISTYLPFADEATIGMFRATLEVVNKQNQLIKQQREEIEYQSEVIEGLVEDISLADKRQILNRVMKHNNKGDYISRWRILYREFDNRYHINTKIRMERYNSTAKKKMQSRVEYIDKQLNMISELYEIAAKLFHEEVNQLIDEIYKLRVS